MINRADLEKLTNVMKAMSQYELALAELYRTCAEASPADATFWANLAAMEVSHADYLERMIGLLTAKQERFEMGRPFNLIALNTALAGIRENILRISQGTLTREKMFIMARDLEQSLLEANYGEVVKTADVEFQTLLKDIISQTYYHKKMLQEEAAKAKPAG